MKNYDLLLHLLEELESHWDMAQGIRVLLLNGKLGDDKIEEVISLMKLNMEKVSNLKTKNKIESTIKLLEKIRQTEKNENIAEKKHIENIIDEL